MQLQYLRIGSISTTHGLDGKLKIHPTISDLSVALEIPHVYLLRKGSYECFDVEHISRIKSELLLKMKGIDDIETSRRYIGTEVYVDRDELEPLEEDECYIPDLLGLSVVTDDGKTLGKINDVIETGANDVYSVRMENGKDVLIPAIHDCILDVDIDGGKMTVHLLPGLIDEENK